MTEPHPASAATAGHVALLGLGEVGRILAEDLRALKHDVMAHDVAWHDPGSPASRNAADLGVVASTLPESVRGAALVVCAVTPGASVQASRAAAPHLDEGTWFFASRNRVSAVTRFPWRRTLTAP